jgi:hypothetical protein
VSGIYQPLRIAAARERERSELLPRLASLTQVIRFTGTGQHTLGGEQAVPFGALMLEVPTFTYGVVAPYGLAGDLPLIAVAVTGWLVNAAGLYHGAEIAVRVHHPDSAAGSDVLEFHLMFTGVTLRTSLPEPSA